jgi:hypothetical protein
VRRFRTEAAADQPPRYRPNRHDLPRTLAIVSTISIPHLAARSPWKNLGEPAGLGSRLVPIIMCSDYASGGRRSHGRCTGKAGRDPASHDNPAPAHDVPGAGPRKFSRATPATRSLDPSSSSGESTNFRFLTDRWSPSGLQPLAPNLTGCSKPSAHPPSAGWMSARSRLAGCRHDPTTASSPRPPAAALHQHVEDLAFMVDGSPEIHPLAVEQ